VQYYTHKLKTMKNNRLLNILVPLDFSEASLNSLETAIALAKQQHAKITLMNVVDSSLMFAFKGVAYISEKTIDSMVDVSSRMLDPLLARLKEEHQLECSSEIKVGLVPQAIINTAYHIDADLIIMGTHGVSGIRKFFMGSTAQKVIKISNCPVLTVPSNHKWVSFKKILFPIRPVEGAEEKYDYLMKIIANTQPSIEVMVLASTYDEKEKKLLQNLVKEVKRKAAKDKVKISDTLKLGNKMSKSVLKMSKSMNADMIVLTDTNTELKQFFIGPFEQHIINHATMPVLNIRSQLESSDLQVAIQQIHESFPNQIPAFA
jgi:nucleotide-binding universal stress UspA family protein